MTLTGDEVILTTEGCLLDLDGTLIFSKGAVERVWAELSEETGIDLTEILHASHGRRTIETLQLIQPDKATPERAEELENRISTKYAQYAVPIRGVHKFLEDLPTSQWAVVTSGTKKLASNWLNNFLHVKIPDVFVTAESVEIGKPDPTCYLAGAKGLGISKFLVFEDAPAGIKAGKAAGGTVIGLATTYSAEVVKNAGADYVINDLEAVSVESWDPQTKALKLKISPLS
jgi:glycerol 3-phosphatase-1